MNRIDKLTQQVARHLAGRPVTVKWQDPPSATAVGQAVKTPAGDLVIYIGNLTGVNSRFKVYLHELSHARLDHDWIPVSTDHKREPSSIKRTQADRETWRKHPRELRAQLMADTWLQYAEQNAHKYFTGYQSSMELLLMALLDWREP